MKPKLFVLVFLLSLTACAPTKLTVNTPSGRPEVNIPYATKKQVLNEFLNQNAFEGF